MEKEKTIRAEELYDLGDDCWYDAIIEMNFCFEKPDPTCGYRGGVMIASWNVDKYIFIDQAGEETDRPKTDFEKPWLDKLENAVETWIDKNSQNLIDNVIDDVGRADEAAYDAHWDLKFDESRGC